MARTTEWQVATCGYVGSISKPTGDDQLMHPRLQQIAAGAGYRGETLEEQNAQAKDLCYKQVG